MTVAYQMLFGCFILGLFSGIFFSSSSAFESLYFNNIIYNTTNDGVPSTFTYDNKYAIATWIAVTKQPNE